MASKREKAAGKGQRERSITPGRRKGGRRKGSRHREEEGKRGQQDTDLNQNLWYEAIKKEIKEQSSGKEPQNADELLGKKDRPLSGDNRLQVQKSTRKQLGKKDRLQTGDERNQRQVQNKSEDRPESSNFLNFMDRLTNQSATESDRNPTNRSESTGDRILPFLNYFWMIEPLEGAPSLSASKSAAILEAREEGIMPEKSSLQEDDGASLKVHRRKRWLSTTPKTAQDRDNDTQGYRLEEEHVPGRELFSQKYGPNVEDALEEEEYLKSRNCMSFRRLSKAKGSGMSFSRVLSKSSLDAEMDQTGRNKRQGPRFKEEDGTGLRVEDAPKEEDFSKPRNCMSFRRNPEARGGDESRREPTSRRDTLTIEEEEEARRRDMQKFLDIVRHNVVHHERNKSRDDDEQVPSQWRAPRVESRKRGEHERAARRNWLARHGTLDQDYGANVDDVRGKEDYSETRNCMSFRRNPSTRGSHLGRLEESRRESTSRRDRLRIEEEEKEEQYVATRDVSRLQDVSTLPGIERRPSSLPAAELALPAKMRSLPAKSRESAPIWQSRSEVEERAQPQSRKGSSLWRPEMWGLPSLSGIDSLEAEESIRFETRKPAPAVELALPAEKPSLPKKRGQSAPIWQSRSDGSDLEERVQPQPPKGEALWKLDMWGLLSRSVDSLDAEESTRCETRKPALRKPICINRSPIEKKALMDAYSIRAASWDSYDDEECYSNNSSVSSVYSSAFSLESLEGW
jgi:hypothetical protein